MSISKDLSLSAISAGFIAVLIGFASAMAIVFQAATAAGATEQMIESWVWALGLGMGISSFGLSWWYKRPIIIAWSTPGAALLATSLTQTQIEVAIGVFVFVGVLIVVVGISGWFTRLSNVIPLPLASAMLAGILVQFGLHLFDALASQTTLVAAMCLIYLLCKVWLPRYAIALVLTLGLMLSAALGLLQPAEFKLALAVPVWVTPEFSFSALIGIGIPLFIVTMTSQNLPGVAILKASGYESQPMSPLITSTGITTMLLAPFGGFTFNLAAITAAICTSEEAHKDPSKRYVAGLSVGVFNILAGLFGATVVGLFAAFPSAMVAALAGLALLSTIGSSLHQALVQDTQRDAAVITFLVTASGIQLMGIGSAFWGIVFGALSLWIFNRFSRT
jgi:benzoate membrane transport protein